MCLFDAGSDHERDENSGCYRCFPTELVTFVLVTPEMEMWSSQLFLQFKQLQILTRKKI